MKKFSKYYDYYYDKASTIPQQLDLKEIKKFSSIVENDKSYDILDLGCAEGELAIFLAKKGHNITAVDISEKQIKKVSKKSDIESLNINVIKTDIQNGVDLFNEAKYDYIFLMDVIEHLMNPILSLENIRLLLKDDGKLIIHTPNTCSAYKYLRYFLLPYKKQNFYNFKKTGDLHLQSYDYLTIEKTLNFIGIKVEKIIPTYLSFPIINRLRFLNGLFVFLAKLFPLLADTILIVCNKKDPIDVDKLIDFWEKK